MSNLVTTPKNGGLATKNSKGLSNFPWLSSLMEDWFMGDLPPTLSANFNTGMTLPKVNIRETADSYYVDMAVPGLKKSDFQIGLENQMLSISVEQQNEDEHGDANFTRREYGYSSFKRSFNLPESVDDAKINAKYQDGILSIALPKREEAKKKPPKTIKVS